MIFCIFFLHAGGEGVGLSLRNDYTGMGVPRLAEREHGTVLNTNIVFDV